MVLLPDQNTPPSMGWGGGGVREGVQLGRRGNNASRAEEKEKEEKKGLSNGTIVGQGFNENIKKRMIFRMKTVTKGI
jgi:hypothetical protein